MLPPEAQKSSVLLFFVPTSMFWSSHLYNHDLELCTDPFLVEKFIKKSLDIGTLKINS